MQVDKRTLDVELTSKRYYGKSPIRLYRQCLRASEAGLGYELEVDDLGNWLDIIAGLPDCVIKRDPEDDLYVA